MNKKILIIGGYGNVGRIIAARLSEKFPGQVIAAGRNYQKAKEFSLELEQRIIPMELDISRVSANDGLLDDVGIVIMCLDQENIEFVRQCIRRGIHYIDISASYSILSKIETLNDEAGKARADVNTVTKYGVTALKLAKDENIIILLKEAGASWMKMRFPAAQ